jgi:hypothetical protein
MTTLAVLTLLAPGARGSQEALSKLLPAKTAVKNWPQYEGTLTYSPSADTLHKIYDGGDKTYMDAGCVEAIQQSYRNPTTKHIATVTVHRLKDAAKAKAFYQSWRKDVAKTAGYKQLSDLKTAGHLFFGVGSSAGYCHHKAYFVVVDVAGTGADDKAAAGSLLRDVAGRIK